MSASAMRGLLFTDIEDSTGLVRALGDRYEDVLQRHQDIIRAAAHVRSGVEEARDGDSLFVTFPSAAAALESALDAQCHLEREPWPPDARVRVRMGVHVGEVTASRAGLVGLAIHSAARIMSAGHGGQIVVSDDVAGRVGALPEGATTRPLGAYQLRGIGEAELHQLVHPELQGDFPPLRAVRAPEMLGASSLPTAVSPIVGRRHELDMLCSSMRLDRLVTLTGVGGIGKTRLAVEVAARTDRADGFGPYLVDLAPITDLDLVPAAIAGSLGVQIDPGADVLAMVRTALAAHSVVMVVDNCEHLLPRIAELIGRLLASCPGLRVLATSREPLGVDGERVCRLDPLAVPPVVATADDLERSEAGALLLARLPMRVTTGSLTPEELRAAGTICRCLEGIALGIELAAARSGTVPLPELADQLAESIGVLAPSRHGSTPRHRTMRSALDWGYRLLSPPAQSALRAMSVFAGGCDLEAFTAACHDGDDPPAVDVIDELARTCFATVDDTYPATRYRLLEPVRQYAHELLDGCGETVDRRRRHLEHYLLVARNRTRDVDGLGETILDELRIELGNFRVALDWAADDTECAAAGLSLAARLYSLWVSDGHHEEGLSRLVALLDSGAGSTAVRVEAAYRAGYIADELNETDRARRLWQQALDEAVDGGDKLGELRTRHVLSECALLGRGDVATALRHLDIAIEIATDESNELLRAKCTLGLANLEWFTGKLREAGERVRDVLAALTDTTASLEGWARAILGNILRDQGDHAAARAERERALAIAESEQNLFGAIANHLGLAEVEAAAGCFDDAAAHLDTAELLRPDTARIWDHDLLIVSASLALTSRDDADALAFAQAAAAIESPAYSAGVDGISVNRCLGDSHLALGDAERALANFVQMIAKADAASHACRLAEGHEGAAAAASALGHGDDARNHLIAAARIRRRTASRRLPRPAVDELLLALEGASASK